MSIPKRKRKRTDGERCALATGSDEAARMIEDAHLRMMAAWRDLMEWEQLATNTRKALREAGKDPDREPYCPSQAGISRTLMVRLELGVAAQKLRRLLPHQNINGEPRARRE